MRQTGCKAGQELRYVSPLPQFDRRLEKVMRERTLHIMAPRMSKFDRIWEISNRVL
jgi:hypothetical protein